MLSDFWLPIRLCSQIVDFLNDLYSCFDDIISQHDVYKVWHCEMETVTSTFMSTKLIHILIQHQRPNLPGLVRFRSAWSETSRQQVDNKSSTFVETFCDFWVSNFNNYKLKTEANILETKTIYRKQRNRRSTNT